MSNRIEVTVATQNILLDKSRTKRGLVLPQDDRIDSITATLGAVGSRLDVIGIQEAYKSKHQHNGRVLADKLGCAESYWFSHNQPPCKRAPYGIAGEYIGMFGEMVNHAESVELGDNRLAVMTVIANVAFVTIHLRSGSGNAKNYDTCLIAELDEYPDAVILGDFNEPPVPIYSAAR